SVRPTPVGEPALRLRWERRLVALLVVSLRPDAETEHQPVSIVQELITTAANFGGHVEEINTLGVVVAFGIDPAEDAARRAAYAALAMLKVVERSRTSVSRVTARCAIGVVRCLVALGSVVGMDATARRKACITLEELLDAAEPGTIMVS